MSANLPDPILRILNVAVVAIIYLFLLRIIRAVWAELKEPADAIVVPASQVSSNESKKEIKRGTAKTLRVVEPQEWRGRNYQLTSELTVGRAEGCHISLDDSYTSQLHARLFRQDGQAYVEDLGSTNGTFINRRKVTAPTPIHSGDRLQIGRTVFEVRK